MDIDRFRTKLLGQLRSSVSDSEAENLANLLSDEVHLTRLYKRFGPSQECIDRLFIHAQKMKNLEPSIKVKECVIRQSIGETTFSVEFIANSTNNTPQLVFCLLEFLRQELMLRHYQSLRNVSQVSIVLDAQDIDFKLLTSMELGNSVYEILSLHFPHFVKTVYIMNASWMQKSVWKMCQTMISESARQRVKFIEGAFIEYLESLEESKECKDYLEKKQDLKTRVLMASSRATSVATLMEEEDLPFYDAPETPTESKTTWFMWFWSIIRWKGCIGIILALIVKKWWSRRRLTVH